jgi:lipopolysaccharide transport system ATP-binding protein
MWYSTMSNVITVENLGKKYTLRHQQQESYAVLRDVITKGVASLARKFIHPFRGSRSSQPALEEFWALKDVSFEVKRGDRIGIIGRNGAGKSTLLKILSRITEPTAGSVRIKGRVASLLEVGTGFHPELTGRENIFLNGAILGMSRAEIKKKFDEIVDFAEIVRFLDTPVKRYSSGMYVRLAFAVAAHLDPEILVVDEVLAVGDAQFQKKCLGKIEDVSAKEERTVLFVSHNMSAIRSLCSSALLLEQGHIVFSGPTLLAIDKYIENTNDICSCDFPLREVARLDYLGRKLRINRVQFNGGSSIYHGKSVIVDISYVCYSDVDGVSFGVGICNKDGARILSIDSDIPGNRIKLFQGDQGVASFAIPTLFLEPDIYTFDIGSRSGDNYGLDYLPQCGRIVVLPSELTPAVIANRESGQGGIRYPADWSFTVISK